MKRCRSVKPSSLEQYKVQIQTSLGNTLHQLCIDSQNPKATAAMDVDFAKKETQFGDDFLIFF